MRLHLDPSFNAADPQDVAATQRLEEMRARQARNDLVVALRYPEVRRVLWRVLEQANVFDDIWTPDALALAHRTGRQSVGRFLWAAIDDVDEAAVMAMRADARARIRQLLAEADSMRTPATEEE